MRFINLGSVLRLPFSVHFTISYCVHFSPYGYYFASCGMDRTARLWSTDHHQPLRVFSGHQADVDVSLTCWLLQWIEIINVSYQ